MIFQLLSLLAILWGVDVKMRADSPQDQLWARLTILVLNNGSQSLMSPKAAYDFTVPTGKIPVCENWQVGDVSTRLEKKSDTEWRLWLELQGSIAPGKGWNDPAGAVLGIHLSDWSTWQPWSASSWDGNTGTLVSNTKIRLWDATGLLLWGPAEEITQPPVSGTGFSSVYVKVGQGGRCNAVGTVSLASGDILQLRCQSGEASKPAQIWFDGILQAKLAEMDVSPDGKDHQIDVTFPAKAELWHQINVVGTGGACDPVPSARGYEGEALAVACAAAAGNRIDALLLDGAAKIPAVRMFLQGDAAHRLDVRFASMTSSVNVVAEAFRDVSNTAQFSVYRLRVRNAGTTPLRAGWSALVPFRIPDHFTPVVSAWDMPSAQASFVTGLGDGWYLLKIVATSDLQPGSISGDQRGWYFALSLAGSDAAWDRSGDVAMPAGTTWTTAPYVRVLDAQGVPVAGAEWLMKTKRDGVASVEVRYLDEGLSSNIARPRIIVKNTGTVPLSDFVYDYHFCTENGKQPILEPWYKVSPSIHLEALGGFCFKARYDFTGVTLLPGQEIPNATGNVVGLHYGDWTTWDRGNDWSSTNTTSGYQVTNRIPVYDKWGNLIGGEPPDWDDGDDGDDGDGTEDDGVEYVPTLKPPVIVLQPSSVTEVAGSSATFEVRASGDGALTYQWRVNGTDLPGATDPVLQIGLVGTAMSGNKYTVAVTGAGGTVVSNGAILVVKEIPRKLTFLVQPQDATVQLGDQARFDVVAEGQGVVKMQWYRGARPIVGETSSGLLLRGQTWSDTALRYWVRASDESGARLDSRKAKVVVKLPDQAILRIPLEGAFSLGTDIPADTTVDLLVRLYDKPVDGSLVWVEKHRSVPVVGGRWKVEFGQSAGMPSLAQVVATHPSLHLELALDATQPRVFHPRMALTAIPTALQSGASLSIGQGAPTSRADLPVGTLYLDQTLAKTWFHDVNGWRALEP